jgi:short-chain fatty acids transporter
MSSGASPAPAPEREVAVRREEDLLSRYARVTGRLVPDAVSTSVFMLVALVAIAIATGNTVETTVDAWYRGLWMLLPFTMQMTLVVLLGSVLAATPLCRRAIVALARRPRSAAGVLSYCVLAIAGVSYVNWGFALALGPLISIHFAAEAERRGIAVDFPFLMAATGAAGSVWQFGLSSSAALLMATPGHFLEGTTGTMPLRTTIWSPAAVFMVVSFTALSVVAARLLMPRVPKQLSEFPAASRLADLEGGADAATGARPDAVERGDYSRRLEASRLTPFALSAALGAWLYYHFVVKGGGLDLNSFNTGFFMLCLLLHGSVRGLAAAAQRAIVSCWPIVLLYPLYGGVAGLIQFTTVGESLAGLFLPVATVWTFALLTALAGTLVAVFVPSSGGQWVIQGYLTVRLAEQVGLSPQRGLLALGVGDHMGNLVSPFWFAVRAEIARIDFRTFFGYGLIFALIWFVCGVVAFTFLPC